MKKKKIFLNTFKFLQISKIEICLHSHLLHNIKISLKKQRFRIIEAKALYFKKNSSKVLHDFFYEVMIKLIFLIILKICSTYPGESIWHIKVESDWIILIEVERIVDSKTMNNHTVTYFASFIISWTGSIGGEKCGNHVHSIFRFGNYAFVRKS